MQCFVNDELADFNLTHGAYNENNCAKAVQERFPNEETSNCKAFERVLNSFAKTGLSMTADLMWSGLASHFLFAAPYVQWCLLIQHSWSIAYCMKSHRGRATSRIAGLFRLHGTRYHLNTAFSKMHFTVNLFIFVPSYPL